MTSRARRLFSLRAVIGARAGAFVVLLAGARAQSPSIEGRLHIYGGSYPDHVRFVDIDGDGRRDLIRGGDAGVSFLRAALNLGNGAFRTVVDELWIAPVNPSAFACGDLDGDGDRDIVYARDSQQAAILTNAGNSTFTETAVYAIPSLCVALELADVDGDSDLDILAAGFLGGQLRVLLNQGTGSFVAGSSHDTGSVPSGMAVADIDLDGDLDVVVSSSGESRVSVLFNLGTGSFAPRVPYIVGASPTDVFLVDVDADGDRDIVVANSAAASVSVLTNLGGGAFGTAVTYSTGPACRSIEVADLDGNGSLDIAASNGALTGGVSVLINAGNGTFAPFVRYGEGSYVQVGALDVDEDGDVDLAVVGGVALSNRGDGTFSVPAQELYPPGVEPDIETGDLDGDGDVDVAILNGSTLDTRMNLGGGHFGPPISSASFAMYNVYELLLSDFDGDGDLDAAIASPGSETDVFLNPGNGAFGTPVFHSTGAFFWRLAAVDVNADGRLDVVSMSTSGFFAALNLGGGTFAPFTAISGTTAGVGWWDVADLDGDGDPDLLSGGQTGIYFHSNNGSGMFAAPTLVSTISVTWQFLAGDLDNDGDQDLVVANDAGVSVLQNLGAGTFGAPGLLGGEPGALSILDLDHDGDRDVLCIADENSVVFDNLGGANFAPPVRAGSGGASDLAPLDVDRDGDLDLVGCDYQRFFVLQNRTASGVSFCAGDGSATACPCGNASAPGSGAGCTNSSGSAGILTATGSTSLLTDTLRLHGAGMTNSAVLYFQGTIATNGGAGVVFGDGLRCAGGTVIRLDVEHNVGGASISPGAGDPPLRVLGQVTTPGARRYQAWYRDAQAFCTGATSNLTNGLAVTWSP